MELTLTTPHCKGCGKNVEDAGYGPFVQEEGLTPDEYIRRNEGTYNPATGLFWCDPCYIDSDMPLGRA